MLADSTLAELTKSAPSREAVVRMAWPSLDVASKLRVIELVQGFGGYLRGTPDWLHELAMRDEAAIVRYWSARAFTFRHGPVAPSDSPLGMFRTTEEDVARTEQARSDPEPLVQATVNQQTALNSYAGLEVMPQLERLQLLREDQNGFFERFVDWLVKCVDEASVSDEQLNECLYEVLASRQFRDIALGIDSDVDGYFSFSTGKALEKGWALASRAGPYLATTLVQRLPFSFPHGLGGVDAEALDALPPSLQKWLLYRDDEPVAAAFLERVRENPERYDATLVEELKKWDDSAWERGARSTTPSHEHELPTEGLESLNERLDKVMEATRELYELVREASNRKRGIFG